MSTEILMAFLIGVVAAALLVGLTIFLTLYIRGRAESGGTVKKSKKKGAKKGGGARGGSMERKGEYSIRLSDNRKSGKAWQYQLRDNEELLIGRGDECDLQLSDKTVSHLHCKIMIGERGLEVADMGAKKRTKQNGVLVYDGSPLKRGDILSLGHEELLVESIQHMGQEKPGDDYEYGEADRERERERNVRQHQDINRDRNPESGRPSHAVVDDTQAASPWNASARGREWRESGDNAHRRGGNQSAYDPLDDTQAASPWNASARGREWRVGESESQKQNGNQGAQAAHDPLDDTQAASSWNRRHEN